MDLSSPTLTTNSPLTPVFGDVPDILGTGILHENKSAIITVNSTNDAVDDLKSGFTTLRDAILQANADNGEDLIIFDRSLFSTAQTISLSLGELDITHNLDIIAPRDSLTGGDLVTVSGNNSSRVFEIEKDATVNLSGLIVESGKVMGDGGGIKNSGTLTLDSSIVHNNLITPTLDLGATGEVSGSGGGIYNTGDLNLNNSTISGNTVGGTRFGGNGGGIYNTGTVNISNSTISGNSGDATAEADSGFGGGIFNSDTGVFDVSNSTISDNSAVEGGGISNFGTIAVSNTTISSNLSRDRYTDDGGGAIQNRGNAVISNSLLSGNSSGTSGGAISNSGIAVISNTTISGNSGNYYGGGGIFNNTNGTVKVSNSTITGNKATNEGGGILNSGNLEVSNSTLDNNQASFGGGISNATTNGNVKISNSTISNNQANTSSGGGIYNVGNLEVSNSTLSGNLTVSSGGGIYNDNSGISTLVFDTITLNKAANGGGVFNATPVVSSPVSNSVSVRNTIIAANLNSDGGVNPDVSGTFTSSGYNLIGDSTLGTGFDATGDIVGTSDNPIDPKLAPLDFYGGPTQTIALLPDSPAIDAGDPTVLATDPTTDQRGLDRVSNGRSDIGAFEVQV